VNRSEVVADMEGLGPNKATPPLEQTLFAVRLAATRNRGTSTASGSRPIERLSNSGSHCFSETSRNSPALASGLGSAKNLNRC